VAGFVAFSTQSVEVFNVVKVLIPSHALEDAMVNVYQWPLGAMLAKGNALIINAKEIHIDFSVLFYDLSFSLSPNSITQVNDSQILVHCHQSLQDSFWTYQFRIHTGLALGVMVSRFGKGHCIDFLALLYSAGRFRAAIHLETFEQPP